MRGPGRARPGPSPIRGARSALRAWRLVLAVWLAPVVGFGPALLVVELGVGSRLAALPASASAGDLLLVAAARVEEMGAVLVASLVAGCVLLWVWTLLWQAAMVVGRGIRPAGLAAQLGRGLRLLWPYARLSAAAAAAFAVALAAVGTPVAWGVRRAREAMAEELMVTLAVGGLVLLLVVWAGCWSATLAGGWRLGADRRRSALRALLGGLGDTLRSPSASVATVATWVVPAALLGAAPLLLGAHLAGARGGAGGALAGVGCTLLRAFCWVALLASFAPTGGNGGNLPADPPFDEAIGNPT